jgi:TonB family protein
MLELLAANPLTRAVGLALLHFVWQGAAIAAVAELLWHSLRHGPARIRYIVGCLALLSMAVSPVVTMTRALDEPAAGATRPGAAAAAALDGAAISLPAPRAGHASVPHATSLLPAVVLVWLSGVAFLTVNLTAAWMRARRLRRTAQPVGAEWRAQLDRIAERLRLRSPITLSASTAIEVPTLVGWIRPAILLPGSVLTGLTPTQLDAILTHELAHVRRHDYLVNVLQSAIETLLFYHPAVWWVSRRVRLERELCCDDVVVATCGDRVTYARALASLEELRGREPAIALAATGGPLLARIRRILSPGSVDVSRSSAWTVLTVAAAVAPTLVFGGAVESAMPAATMETVEIAGQGQPRSTAEADRAAVLALEVQLRLARAQSDMTALNRLVDDAYTGMSLNGTVRDKAGTLEVWTASAQQSLALNSADVRVNGDLATVSGGQTEIIDGRAQVVLFTRIWRRADTGWRLFSATEFRDPRPPTAARGGQAARPLASGAPASVTGARRSAATGQSAAGSVAGRPPLSAGTDVQRPKKIKDVPPVYPAVAKAARVTGTVVMEVVIDESGAVGDVRVLRGVPLLDQAAVDAVRQWRYTPTLRNGQPVAVRTSVTVTFAMQ